MQNTGILQRKNTGSYYIPNMYEISTLISIFVDFDVLSVQNTVSKDGKDTCVGIP